MEVLVLNLLGRVRGVAGVIQEQKSVYPIVMITCTLKQQIQFIFQKTITDGSIEWLTQILVPCEHN